MVSVKNSVGELVEVKGAAKKKAFCKVEYSMMIMEKRSVLNGDKEVMEIKGVAIKAGKSRNGVIYEAEELKNAAKTLEGKPLLLDHVAEIDSIVGRVVESVFDIMDESIRFTAEIMDERIKEMVRDGRIQNVSIGAIVEDMEEDGEDLIAKGIEFLELSLVSVPGIAGAKIDSFDEALKRSMMVINEGYEKSEKKLSKVEELEAEVEVLELEIFRKAIWEGMKLNGKEKEE